jgi:hypothetical protein
MLAIASIAEPWQKDSKEATSGFFLLLFLKKKLFFFF